MNLFSHLPGFRPSCELLLLALATVAAVGCGRATPVGAVPAPSVTLAVAPPKCTDRAYRFEPPSSSLEVVGGSAFGDELLRIERFVAVLTEDRKVLSLRLEADFRSLHADSAKTEKFIKSPDYFDVERFPALKFTSTEIRLTEAPSRYRVEGALELHGVTRQSAFDASIELDDAHALMTIELTIDRYDYDIRTSPALEAFLDRSLRVWVRFQAAHAEPAEACGLAPATPRSF